jgi:parvulin-like peptidyl-prolyl isomerase
MVRKGTVLRSLLGMVAAICIVGFCRAATSSEQPAVEVVARVNGEPIYRNEVTAGIGRDMFGDMLQDATATRLERLISIVATRQHLKAENIEVANEDVEKEVNELKRNPPSAGCSCCRYRSLEEFLAANLLTMKDLRECVRNDLGIDKYVMGLWNKEHPAGEAREKLVSAERQRVEKGYTKVAHIFFNTAQQPEFQADPVGVREKIEKKALAVWHRLQAGEDFAKLVQDCSEDSISRPKGGHLGCVPRLAFGREFDAAILQLKPDAYSRPVESPWGVHIVRREAITDQDVLDVVQSEYKDKKIREVYDSVREQAKVERYEKIPGKE